MTTHATENEEKAIQVEAPRNGFVPGRAISDDSSTHTQVFYSHKRGVVYGTCKLCGSQDRLLLGHIIPKWAISMLSGKTIYNTYNSVSNYYTTQDGGKEYMFCQSCEHHLGAAENYISHLARGTRADMDKIGVQIEVGGTLHRIDHILISRGILGIFYKAHLSKIPMYASVKLDTRLYESMRHQLLTDSYVKNTYHLQSIKWFDWSDSGALPRDSCSVSLTRSSTSTIGYIQMGGMEFRVHFQTQGHILKEFSTDSFLTENRPWNILVADVLDQYVLGTTQEELHPDVYRRIDVTEVPLNSACPCQSVIQENYQNCCYSRWYPSERRVRGDLIDTSHRCEKDTTCVLAEPKLNLQP